MTTGEKIAALRRDHKLSQEALGEKLGLSRQAVSKWEADQAVPTMDNLMELSRLFGVPVDTLLRPDAPFPAAPAEENSIDAPAAPETPHKGVSLSRGKILAIGGAALLCVSLALNAVCLYQIAQLKGEVQALRAQAGNVNTVYYPGTDADTGDFAESSEHMTLDPENTEQLIVTFSAVPRVASDGETAKFLLRGGEQSWECEAEDDAGGGYRGSLTIPMVDEYSVYLVLTDRNGGTRNLLIASEYDIENRFSIGRSGLLVERRPDVQLWQEHVHGNAFHLCGLPRRAGGQFVHRAHHSLSERQGNRRAAARIPHLRRRI